MKSAMKKMSFVARTAAVVATAAALSLGLYGCGEGDSSSTAQSDDAASVQASWADFPTTPLKLYDEVPASYEELPTVTPDELHEMIEAGEQMVIVDVNTAPMYKDGHIPGAINIPWELGGFSQDPELPRGVTLVFYCVCAAEEDSGEMGYSAVSQFAYRNIVLLKGGTPGWEAAGYSLES